MSLPSPSFDHFERPMDLNEKCVKKPNSTFFMRASGNSMKEAGIFDDDLLIIDRSLTAFSKSIVVIHLDSEVLVRRILRKKNLIRLYPENPEHAPLTVTPEMDFEILGVVTYVIHHARKGLETEIPI